MAYEKPEQQVWVARFTEGKVPPPDGSGPEVMQDIAIAKKEEEERKLKLSYLSIVRERVSAQKDKLREAFVFAIQVEGKTLSTVGAGGDQTQTIDSREAGKRLDQAVSMTQMKLMIEGEDFLKVQREYLQKPRRLVPGRETEPLFPNPEIAAEVYTPLVREQVLPESFVRNEVSDVQQMLDESNKFYMKELEKYKDDEKSELGERLKTGVGAAADFATAITGVALSEKHAETAKNFIELGKAVFETGVDTVEAVRAQSVSGTQLVLNGVGSVIGSLMGGVAGKAMQAGFKSAGNAVAMAGHLSAEPPDVDAFLSDLVGMVGVGFTAAGMVTEGKTKDNLGLAAPNVTLFLSTMVGAKKKKLVEQIRKGEWTAVANFIGSTAAKATKSAFATKNKEDALEPTAELKKVNKKLEDKELDPEEKEKLEKRKEELAERLEDLAGRTESSGEGLDESAKLLGEAVELSENAKAELEKLEKKASDKGAEVVLAESERVLKRLEDEQKAHLASLAALGKVQPDENDLKSIAALIAKMEKDRAIMATALSLASAGTAVLAEFFAPMAGTVTLVQFVGNLQAAAERAMAMRTWMEARGDALAAVSPYQTTIANFVKNQAEQFSHYAIKAALNLVKAATQFAAAGGLTAHVAKVAEAVVKLSETAEELIYKVYQEKQLERAWELTREALSDPQNRRLGLMARGLNPTLAKYTIAWGAVVKRDTIAVSAMARIGLDRETLARRDASVGEVKRFLDTLYKDDQTVLGEFSDQEWPEGKPPQPALQARVWATTVAAAKQNRKVYRSEHDVIVQLLKRIEQHEQAYQAAKAKSTLSVEMLDEYVVSITMLSSAFASYDPRAESGTEAPVMKQLTMGFAQLADSKRVEVMQAQVELG